MRQTEKCDNLLANMDQHIDIEDDNFVLIDVSVLKNIVSSLKCSECESISLEVRLCKEKKALHATFRFIVRTLKKQD